MAVKSIFFKHHVFDISYEILNKDAKYDIIILHGWGSNKELMKKAFGGFLKGFRHIYIDLPGFGNSTSPVSLDSSEYARLVELFLVEINGKKDIALGHSFGGKIATLLEPDLLVLLSSAGIKLPKSFGVLAKIYIYKFFKLFGLTKFRKYFVSDDAKELNKIMYDTFKTVVDEDFKEIFKNYEKKALLCWGNKDTATPPKAGDMIHSYIKNSKFIEFEGDHYFFLNHAKIISENIEKEYING